jgi:hypothetical protein
VSPLRPCEDEGAPGFPGRYYAFIAKRLAHALNFSACCFGHSSVTTRHADGSCTDAEGSKEAALDLAHQIRADRSGERSAAKP